MEGNARFLSGLPQRPWARVVAMLSTLVLLGCHVTIWGPLPRPVALADGMQVKIPAGGRGAVPQKYAEFKLSRPHLEGDSVISAVAEGRAVWVRVDEVLVPIGRRFDGMRTALAVGGVVVGGCALAVLAAYFAWSQM